MTATVVAERPTPGSPRPYHFPPFVEVAVGSSMRPPSWNAPPVALIFVHWTAVWVMSAAGSPIVCV